MLSAMLWIVLPVFVAAGSALLAAVVMQARMEVEVARERAMTAEARARAETDAQRVEEQVKAAEEAARRRAFDEVLDDIRVEERRFLRESNAGSASRKFLVVQERLFFRHIPLSDWIERELLLEEGGDRAPHAIAVGGRRLLK